MSYLLHVLAVSVLLTLAAWALERTLTALGRPIRWVWAAAMVGTAGVAVLAAAGVLPTHGMLGSWNPASAGAEARAELSSDAGGAAEGSGARTSGDAAESGVEGLSDLRSMLALPGAVLNRALGGLHARTGSFVSRWGGARGAAGDHREGRLFTAGLLLWGVASSVAMIVVAMSHLRLYRRRRNWRRGTLLDTPVRLSEDFGPAVVGVRRPEVVLPTSLLQLSRVELRLVLLHETEHVRAGDTRLLAGALLPLLLVPWNPLVWLQLSRLRQAVELDCDARVLRSGIPASNYARTLLTLSSSERLGLAPSPALTAPSRHLKRRIRSMKTSSVRSRIPVGLAAAGLAVLFLALACEVEPPTAEVSNEAEASADIAVTDITVTETDFMVGDLRIPVGASPLFVVDQVIFEPGEVQDLDSEEIESVKVLKGEAAASRFGDQGSAGVVLITTKGGDGPQEVEIVEPDYIEGKVAGARIVVGQTLDTSSGEPRGDVRITSESEGEEAERPLVVVDGVPAEGSDGASATMDAENIESVEVLKGAAAAERYGERGRHGVILIKTRN